MTMPPKPGPHLHSASIVAPSEAPDQNHRANRYRSTNGTGGTWVDAWEAPDFAKCPVAEETRKILGSLTGDDLADAKAQLKEYTSRAAAGTLPFEEPAAAGELPAFPDMLEIRVQVNPDAEDVSRRHLLRLYYAEPPDFEQILLALMFARKPRGEDRDAVQTRQIRQAQGRYIRGRRHGATWGLKL